MVRSGKRVGMGCAFLVLFVGVCAGELVPVGSLGNRVQDLPLLGEESTLSDYLMYAALNNPGLEAALDRWKAALEMVPQVSSLPDPMFTYAYSIREVETRVGPQRDKFSLQQTFPWFGKLSSRGVVAQEAANVQRQRYEAAKLALFYRIKGAYYEYYYLGRTIAVTEENVKLLGYLESVARTRYRAGSTEYADVIKAQIELGELEDRLRTLHELRDPLVANLNAALGRPAGAPLPWPSDLPEFDMTVSDEELTAWLMEGNPELRATEFTTAKEEAALDLARRGYFPDLTVGVEYIDTEEATMSGVRDSGKDPLALRFSINLPLWLGKYRAEEREAGARLVAAQKEWEDRENGLIAELKMAVYRFRDAERKIDLYRDSLIPKADQALAVTLRAFAAGKVDFLDLIEAERTLLELRLSYERSLADCARWLAEIEMLIGREIPQYASDVPEKEDELDRVGTMRGVVEKG